MFNKIKTLLFGEATNISNSEIETVVNQIINESISSNSLKVTEFHSYNIIQKKDISFKTDLLIWLLDDTNSKLSFDQNFRQTKEFKGYEVKTILRDNLWRSKLEFHNHHIINCLNIYNKSKNQWSFPYGMFIKQIKNSFQDQEISEEARKRLIHFNNTFQLNNYYKKHSIALLELLSPKDENDLKPVFADDKDELGRNINLFVVSLNSNEKANVYELLGLLKNANASKPTNKYIKDIEKIHSKIGTDRYIEILEKWLLLVKNLKPITENHTSGYGVGEYNWTTSEFLHEVNATIAKGMIWSFLSLPEIKSKYIFLISDIAQKCYTKLPGKGPAAAGVGNACVYVLSQAGLEGVSQLSRLKLRIKQSSTQELIQKYIIEAAEKLGVSPEEIEDMSVSNYGLENGELTEEFGEYSAKISIIAVGKTEIKWSKKDGASLKSEPSAVKKDFADDLKELKNANVQIQKMLSAQRDRLDRTLIQDRTWTWQNFNQYYAEHGLMSYLSDSLIWEFTNDDKQISGYKLNGNWVSVNEDIIQGLNELTSVKLWHPANKKTNEILDWRNFLIKNQIKQPIKQAFREIYLLTDAEVNTRNYSNRMAAHILKQHQFNTLAKLRGWKYSLLGDYDKGYESEIAQINLPKYKMRAEFWISEVNADNAWNDTGIWNYISTDQVRFIDTNENPVNLIDVPSIVFSEIMRDVDLFVGVASVGNDPEWRDNGGLQQFRNYWESYSFGELGELAKTRKEALERLIPRLKIAKVAEIRDKFVVVKGKIRTYKIHIGSGNILMEPNDQYLCIVADRSSKSIGTENVFLPFEGDAVLSIILSKAFLLADDDKITDSTIVSQIKNK